MTDDDRWENHEGSRRTDRHPVSYLEEHGPCINDELPFHPKHQHFQQGVRKFYLRCSARGQSMQGGGNNRYVYYLEEHDPEAVVRRWAEANETTVERVSGWALYHRAPDEFRDAVAEVIGYEHPTEGSDKGDGSVNDPCPFCGDDIKNFRVHRDDCEAL